MLVKATNLFKSNFHVELDREGNKHVFSCYKRVDLSLEDVESLLDGEEIEIDFEDEKLFEVVE